MALKQIYRRINLFGGPNSGKSTIAAKLFADLKIEKYEIELVREYIKSWTYLKNNPESYDQLYVFAKQIREEDIILRNNDGIIITDCPSMINCFYSFYNKDIFSTDLLNISKNFDKKYKPLNIFLSVKRSFQDYNEYGRFHTFEESKLIDILMLKFIIDIYGKDDIFVLLRNYDTIKDFVLEKLNG